MFAIRVVVVAVLSSLTVFATSAAVAESSSLELAQLQHHPANMVVTLIKAVSTAHKTAHLTLSESLSYHRDKDTFISTHPSYQDASLTCLRKREFARLDRSQSVYLDYTGSSLYPSSLVKSHYRWLRSSVAGNPHSTSPASLASSAAVEEARSAVLEFFDADPSIYDVVWTSNATGGFRIVGETYNFDSKRLLIPRDAHNSLNSLARQCQRSGGQFEFIEFDAFSSALSQPDTISRDAYLAQLSSGHAGQKGLAFFTGQSNITGVKLDLSLLPQASSLGWHVGLDAAALAPSTRISLRRLENAVDFMVVSLYKICGFPTGLGALLMKKDRYADMTCKPTFYGGNIIGITMDRFDFSLVEGPERFEDGTANFLAMSSVKMGLEFAASWMDKVAHRNRLLMEWLVRELDSIYYPASLAEKGEEGSMEKRPSLTSSDSSNTSSTGPESISSAKEASLDEKSHAARHRAKLVQIGGPALTSPTSPRGSTLPLVFFSRSHHPLNYRFVIWAAALENISLRGGPCMCNPGASSAIMQRGLITDLDASSLLAEADVGLVRVSLGTATNFKDVWRLVHFVRKLTSQSWVRERWTVYERLHPGSRLENDIEALVAMATRKRVE